MAPRTHQKSSIQSFGTTKRLLTGQSSLRMKAASLGFELRKKATPHAVATFLDTQEPGEAIVFYVAWLPR